MFQQSSSNEFWNKNTNCDLPWTFNYDFEAFRCCLFLYLNIILLSFPIKRSLNAQLLLFSRVYWKTFNPFFTSDKINVRFSLNKKRKIAVRRRRRLQKYSDWERRKWFIRNLVPGCIDSVITLVTYKKFLQNFIPKYPNLTWSIS